MNKENMSMQGGSSQNKERPSNQADPTDSSLSGMLTRILNRLFSLLPWSATGEKPAECVFCRIARGDDPTSQIHHHDSRFVVISDIAPASTHHYLVIPKEHIRDARCLDDRHVDMVREMSDIGKKVLESRGGSWAECRRGFHWPPFISVSHLHMHVIAPESSMSARYDLTFRTDSYWFRSVEAILESLMRLRPTASQLQTPSSENESNNILAKLS